MCETLFEKEVCEYALNCKTIIGISNNIIITIYDKRLPVVKVY